MALSITVEAALGRPAPVEAGRADPVVFPAGLPALHALGAHVRRGVASRIGNANTEGGAIVNLPANVVAGDLVVALIGVNDASSVTAPDGSWTSRGFLNATTGEGQAIAQSSPKSRGRASRARTRSCRTRASSPPRGHDRARLRCRLH